MMMEPTRSEFERRYNVTISDEAFEYLKKFLWEICLDKDTKQFYKDITQDNVRKLVAHIEKKFNGSEEDKDD